MLRKLPALNPDSESFWQGGQDGKLNIYYCEDCCRYFHPPAPVCANCLNENVSPKQVSGIGTVVTFTINHQAWKSDLELPYVIAMIELDEQNGLRLVSNIINCTPDSVYIGMPVKVQFLQQEDIWIPLFEPIPKTSQGDEQ